MKWWTDKLLAKRIVAGDRDACETFIRRHYAPIYRLLVRLCRDADLAEDLTQETFAAAWGNVATYAGASSLATWLHRIAYRKFLDWRRARRSLAIADRDLDEVASSGAGPVEAAVLDEESCLLRRAIDRLPPAERDVLVLHYLQGLSYREMACVLDEPCGTVKWRTSLALNNLRDQLKGQLDEPSTLAERHGGRRAIHRETIAAAPSSAGL
ncbi:MAG TPA: RNA polymerase sigma factor [Pirellulales bacterium]|nr:RNA polymerase sigma factor [Pirellulales bacterium]